MKRVVLAAAACLMLLSVVVVAAESEPARGWLGIRMATRTTLQMALAREELPEEFMAIPRPEDLLEAWDRPGVLVLEVLPETPAELAGLFPGDIVVEFNGLRVDSPANFAGLMRRAIPGRDGTLGILRDGELRELLFVVGERKQEEAKAQEKDSTSPDSTSSAGRP